MFAADAGANLGPSTSEVVDTVALLKLLECLEGRLAILTFPAESASLVLMRRFTLQAYILADLWVYVKGFAASMAIKKRQPA